jgi:molybdopterin-guanine dinucleotide biosynthesis protein A
MILGMVLAGGRSSRMGQDKCQLVLPSGLTLLEHSRDILRQAGLEAVVISGPQPGAIADRRPFLGPLAALETVIHKCQPAALVVIPVDMPLLTPALVQRLLKATSGQARTLGDKQLPLYLEVNPSLKRRLRQLLDRPESRSRSLKALLAGLEHIRLPLSELEERQLANVNTPDQWQQIQQLLNRGDNHGTQTAATF